MPSCLGAAGSVRTRQNIQSALSACDVQIFCAVDDVVRRRRAPRASAGSRDPSPRPARCSPGTSGSRRARSAAGARASAPRCRTRAAPARASTGRSSSAARGSRARASPRRGSCASSRARARRRRTRAARSARCSRARPCARARRWASAMGTYALRPPQTSSSSAADRRAHRRRAARLEPGADLVAERLQLAHAAALARRLRHVERDILDHVLLAADRLAPAQLDQDVARRHAVALAGALGEEQERRVHAGVAEDERVAVDAHRRGPSSARTRSSATSMSLYRSTPCRAPMRSSTATNTSSGVLPAPAPRPAGRGVDARRARLDRRRASWRRPCRGCGGRGSRSRSRAAAPRAAPRCARVTSSGSM